MTGILFDLDGTLLDTLEDLYLATNRTLQHFGCPPRTRQEIRRFVGNGAAMQIHLSLPGTEDDPPEAEVLAHYQAYYNSCDHATVAPYPGVMEALGQVAAKYPVAIVSNKPDPAVKALCAQHFPGIYALGVTQNCPRKPDKAMVCKALEAIGADRCVYVGDSEVDVLTAKNAGAACLTVTWGFRDRADLVAAGAAHFCDDAKDLPQIIETIIQSRA